MRIAIIATTVEFELGGIARSVPLLAAALARNSHGDQLVEVDFYAVKAPKMTVGDSPGQVDLVSAGVNLKLYDDRKALRLALEENFSNKNNRPDFIYHVGLWDPLNHQIAKMGQRYGISLIASPRSMLDPWALRYRRWKKRLAWFLYAKRDMAAAKAIHVTAKMEKGYVEAAGLHQEIFIVPNGVELPAPFSVIPSNGFDVYKKNGEKVLLFLSRIHPKKGLTDLIQVFGNLNPERWHLVIAGNDDGGYQKECERLADQQSNRSKIHFIGAVEDLDKWSCYASADLFALPSYSENFGIVIGEALGMGLPVITTTATPWEGLAEKNCGWWIEPGVASLEVTLADALALPDEIRKEMGNVGQSWIRDQFNWKSIGQLFLRSLR